MRHPVRGLLVGPLIAPPAYWIGVIVAGWDSHPVINWFALLRELGLIFAFGLPIAYVATLLWGAPVLYGLRRFGWLHATTLVAAGAVGGAIVAVLFALQQQGALFQVKMPVAGAAALGALVAAACWWAGKGR